MKTVSTNPLEYAIIILIVTKSEKETSYEY